MKPVTEELAADKLAADELAWNAIVVLHARVEQQLTKPLQRHGLGLSEYRALSRLAAAMAGGPGQSNADKGGMRIQELAEVLGLNESSVSRLADRLEQASLIERCVCQDDRRGVYAYITDAGRHRVASAAPTYRSQLADALDQAATDPALGALIRALRIQGE